MATAGFCTSEKRFENAGVNGSFNRRAVMSEHENDHDAIRLLRALSPTQRLRAAERLYWSARQIKAAGIRAQHPDWSEERVKEAVRLAFFHART